MSYPGNPSLAQDARDRVESTFRNSLQLVEEGKDQEAILGCEFILRMDPSFTPARTLVERIKSGERPVRTGDLGGSGSKAVAPSGGLGAVLQDLLRRRNFRQVLQIAQSQRSAIEADPALQALVGAAQEKLESESFVAKFLDAARQARAQGDEAGARSHLEKARSLDPDHPGIAELESAGEPELADAFVMESAEVVASDDLSALQQQSLGLGGGEDEDSLFSMENEVDDLDDLDGLDEDLEALDLGDDLEEPADEDPGDATRPVATLSASPAADAPESLGDLDDLEDLEDLGGLEGDDLLDFDAIDTAARTDAPAAAPVPAPETEPLDLGADDDELELVDGMEIPDDLGPGPAAAPPIAEEAFDGDDDGRNIQRLLAEGKEAYAGEEYQTAIDIWSRIFLIDIDNGEASRLIEEARKKKAELDRQAEELFHEAADLIERQELEEAKQNLRRVLELQPDHSIAQDYLDQLEAGKVPTVARRGATDESEGGLEDLAADSLAVGKQGGAHSLEAAVQRDRVVVVKKTDKKLVGLGIGALVLVLGGAGYLVSQWDQLFPNAEAPAVAPPREVDPIERATAMKDEGRTENAIALLRKVQPDDPAYGEAQALVDQWTALIESESAGPAGPSQEVLARRELLLEGARDAHRGGHHLRARKYFERAHRVFPLGAEDLAMRRASEDALLPLSSEIENFSIGEYELILPSLWRKLEEQPGNHDVRRLIVDAYYNLAMLDLQRGDPRTAGEKITEARQLDADDEELERIQLFAKTYEERSQDLVYRIFVKYLPSRS